MLLPVRQSIQSTIDRSNILGRISLGSILRRKWLPKVLVSTSAQDIREQLFLPQSGSTTQLNQDIFALIVNRFKPGFFLEIGANDGRTLSNSLYLEEHFNWTGILVEPNPRYRDSLKLRKNSIIIEHAISNTEGSVEFVDAGLYGGIANGLGSTHVLKTQNANRITVSTITIEKLFEIATPPPVIDFLSLDIEGMELIVLRQILLTSHRIRCGCIEFNGRSSDATEMYSLLRLHGYEVVWSNQTGHDIFFIDCTQLRS